MKKIKTKKSKILILTSLALFLIAGSVFAYSKYSNEDNSGTNGTAISDVEDEINYKPPTDEEKKAADNVKEQLSNASKTEDNNSDSIKSVKPRITYSEVYQGNVEVSSHVPEVLEKSGKCTLSLQKGEKTISQSKNAVPNVSEMSCGLIKISTSKLSAGSWTATVTYNSAKAKGTSSEVPIEVK